MSSALVAVSFLCSVVLSLFVVLHCVRRNVPRLALVSWLLGCNVVHGVDASIWASNADLRALVWCDLVTKLVLATTIAVSGACLCIAHYLELVSSSRNLPDTLKAFRNRRFFYLIICYLIPFLYMALHIIGQDHRFDLVQGIGCIASVHPSAVASVVVWLPQALMCILSFVLHGIAAHNSSRHCFSHFSGHLESRSQMNSSTWLRTFSISMTVTMVNSLVVLFSVLSLPMSDSWVSWQHVHLHLSEVFIMTEKRQIAGIEINWWGLRVITICYIFLALVLGEEGRVIIGHLREGAKKISLDVPSLIAPRSYHEDKTLRHRSSFSPPSDDLSYKHPIAHGLRSCWEDDSFIKASFFSRLSSMVTWNKGGARVPSLTDSSPSPNFRTDDFFLKASLAYLDPSTASFLRSNTPIVAPSPVHYKPEKKYATDRGQKPCLSTNIASPEY